MEIYKWIKGFEGRYEISNFGNIRSYKKSGKLLQMTLCNTRGGYLRIKLNNKPKLVHRLVAETFIGEIPKGYVINHLDFNPKNNKLDNLEICTQSKNVRHTHNLGRAKMPDNTGSKNGMSILNEQKVLEIKKLFKTGLSNKKISEMFGVHQGTISDIKVGKTWKHLTCA